MTLCESGLDKNPALGQCLTCSEYLCKDCFAIHQQLKLTKDHSLITLEKIKLAGGSLDVRISYRESSIVRSTKVKN